jgi:hypothetical protein
MQTSKIMPAAVIAGIRYMEDYSAFKYLCSPYVEYIATTTNLIYNIC